MPHVSFTKDYNHRWPSRAMTSFKAGHSGRVKTEVADAAIAKGAATIIPTPARPNGDERLSNIGRSGRVARPDHVDHVGADIRNSQLDGSGK